MTQQTTAGMQQNVYQSSSFPNLYAQNGQVSRIGNTTLSVAVGQFRDSLNQFDIPVGFFLNDSASTPAAVTLNAAVNGANGLDTGALAASTVYAVHAILDPTGFNSPAVLLSLSATAPTMPFGYGPFRRIGWAVTDSSVHFLAITQTGTGNTREYFYDTKQIVLNAGTATSFTAIDLSAFVPTLVTPVTFDYSYLPTAASSVLQLRATGSSATTVTNVMTSAAARAQGQVRIMTGIASSKAEVDYLSSSGSDATTLYVYSFVDNL